MLRLSHALFFSLFFILLSACSNEPDHRLSPLPEEATILALGDSLTYGTGTGLEYSYPSVLERISGYRVVNAGVPGDTTAGGLRRLPALLNEHKPGLVILCLGGNDMLRQMSLAGAKENLRQIIRISREQGIPVLMLGVPRPNLLGLKSADFYRELASEENVPFDGETLPSLLADRGLRSDQIHLNTEGYRRLADAIHNLLQNLNALPHS